MKNKKIMIITGLIFLLFIPMISAKKEMCRDTIKINTNCTMVTPTINCTSYNYSIINLTGVTVQSGNLTVLSEKNYYFNFTRGKGEYIVRLCDGTTREVIVTDEDEDKMVLGIIILLPFLLGLALLYGSTQLSEEHSSLKLFFFLLTPITFFSSMHFALITLIKFYDFPELQNIIGNTTYWIGIIFGVLISYWLIYLFIIGINMAAEKKRKRFEY